MQLEMTAAANANQRWSMVLARDARGDGDFVYAVKSTGVFCRPTCPSRRPKRENIEFFDSPSQAQQAGYRACRRCAPLQRNPQMQKVEAACRYIDDNLDVTLSLTAISRHVEISPFHFQRIFKRALGISPREYQQARRAGKFRQALRGDSSVTEAIYEAGFSSSSRAYESIPAQLGMTPSAYRRGGEGVEIHYTVIPTELGNLLVATTERGVCSVRFGESESEIVRELKSDFIAAQINRNDKKLKIVASQIKQLLSSPSTPLIPLDLRGTAFQQMVWKELRRIPRGETRSYAAVAKTIGRPKAIRAVANACASNPVALVVPCHRVVHTNGKISG